MVHCTPGIGRADIAYDLRVVFGLRDFHLVSVILCLTHFQYSSIKVDLSLISFFTNANNSCLYQYTLLVKSRITKIL